MPNIFDGISKMEEEQIRDQLASLEEVTVSNVMSEMGQKAKRGTVKLFNGLRKLAGAETISEPKVVSMEERISNKKSQLQELDKEALQYRMQMVLVEKVNSASSATISPDSQDEISTIVIEVAAKCFKKDIPENLTPGQKADAIYHRYNERLIAQTKQKYEESSDTEKEEIDRNLQAEIESMSAEQKEELRKALGIEEITGAAVGKLIKTTAGATALMVALETSGFGAYVALTTIIHAIFTTTLGITLPFAAYTTATGALSFLLGPGGFLIFAGVETFMLTKNKNKFIYELLAQVVWSSVMMCGGRFTPKEDALPSWLPKEQREAAVEASAELHGVLLENEKLDTQYQNLLNQVKTNDATIDQKEKKIAELNEKISIAEEKEQKAERDKALLQQNFNDARIKLKEQQRILDDIKDCVVDEETLAAYEKAKNDFYDAQHRLEDNEETIERLNHFIEQLNEGVLLCEVELENAEAKNKELSETNAVYETALSELQKKLDALTDRERNKLDLRWEKTFKRFVFEPGVIKSVVKHYQYNEYGSIESALMELHEAKDPAAIRNNRGKMVASEELHLGFSTSSGFPSRIFYKPIKNQPNGKTVSIVKICKHNDSRYGKK